jgi:hypothetical protein
MNTFTNESGLTLTVSDEQTSDRVPIMGGDNRNPTWDEYLADYKEEFRPHILLIRQAITEMGWVGETGENKANDTYFNFSDGECFSFSWRAWGDLMQAIVNKQEGYMTYYM